MHSVDTSNSQVPGIQSAIHNSIRPLWSNLLVQISQEKAKWSGDVSEWFIEQFIENIIPNVRAHSQRFDLVVDERIRRYRRSQKSCSHFSAKPMRTAVAKRLKEF